MRVLIVNGFPRSGKDTLCNLLTDFGYRVLRFSTVDTIKNIMAQLGWDGSKSSKWRNAMSDLKDWYTKYFDGPFEESKIVIQNSYIYDFVCLHCREPEEILKLKQWCDKSNIDCLTVFVNRKLENMNITNHADSNVMQYSYDVYLDNNNSLKAFAEEIKTKLLQV